MTKKMILSAAVLAAMVLGVMPSWAGSSTVTYVAAPGLRVSNSGVPAGVGGYQFTTPSRPLTLDVDDVNGTGVRVSVCQENDSDPVAGDTPSVCGDGGDDVSISYCTNGNPKNIGPQNFRPNSPISVFVSIHGPALGCSQVGVAGQMVLTW